MITFIVGTDTDVGKTYYGKKLIGEGKFLIKPIETGKESFENIEQSDSYTYSRLQAKEINTINCYFFNNPLSPHLASEIDKSHIDIEYIREFISSKEDKNPYVELAGGLMVPLTRSYTQLDLLKSFKHAKVDLVVGNKLGCINHALLTLELLKANDIELRNLFINDLGKESNDMMKDNEKIIKEYAKNLYKT